MCSPPALWFVCGCPRDRECALSLRLHLHLFIRCFYPNEFKAEIYLFQRERVKGSAAESAKWDLNSQLSG